MLTTFLFPHPGPLANGVYLIGAPRWNRDVHLQQARVTCQCLSTVPTVLGLEVDGTLTDVRVRLLPKREGEDFNGLFNLRYKLAANLEIRWLVLSGPEDVRNLGLTLIVGVAGTDITPTPELYVMFVNGPERVRLFDYESRTFTAVSSALATSRASVTNSPSFSASIQGTLAAECVDVSGTLRLQLHRLHLNGGTRPLEAEPWLEFYRGERRLGSLTKSGALYVGDAFEYPSFDEGADRFELLKSGSVAATLESPGFLTAYEVEEVV